MFGKKENVEIKNIGLVVSPKWPFLRCSADGIVLENGVPIGFIEIKWPYSKKDMMLADAAKGDKAFFLKLTQCLRAEKKPSLLLLLLLLPVSRRSEPFKIAMD